MTALATITGTQNFLDNDGLLRKYGTDKTVPTSAGEYRMPGELREIEFMLDISKLTTTDQIINDQVFFPKTAWVEKVVIDVQVAGATITALNIGLTSTARDSATTTSNAFLDAEVVATLALGKIITYDATTTHHGVALGTALSTNAPGYITANITGSTGTGLLKVRIFYRSSTVTTQ
jgi:hypothetical protein